jgi:ATP-binding cassette, subfamily B, bacterial
MTIRWRRRVPLVQQMERAECGAACLAMVLAHFGREVPLAELRSACGVGRDGMNAHGLKLAAAQHGLTARAMTTSLGQLSNLPVPLIAHWDFNHFVVVESFSRRGARVLDPAGGRRHLGWNQLDEHFTGVALTFAVAPSFEPRRGRAASLARYFTTLSKNRSAVTLLLLAALLLQVLAVSFPSANQILIDHVLPHERVGWLFTLLATLVAASAARVAFTWIRGQTLSRLYMAIDIDLLVRFTDRLFRLPAAFFDQRSPGDLLHRVQANAQLSALATGLTTASLDLLVLFTLSALMFAYDPRLACVTLALSAARVLGVVLLERRAARLTASELALRGREQSVIVDALSMPEVVRAFGLADPLLAKHTDLMTRRCNATLALQRDAAKRVHGATALDGLTRAVLLSFGGEAVLADRMSSGAFIGMMTLHGMLDAPLSAIVQAMTRVAHVRGLLARLADVMDTAEEQHGTRSVPELRGDIELSDVSYQYSPGSPKICDRVCLRIAQGEKIAIVGRSGSGKSTLAKLLVGLLRPQAGQITIDGIPLEELELEALRRNVGIVLQEPFLLDESVRANVDLAGRQLSASEVWRALEIAAMEDVVAAMPQSLESRVGERGRFLSGGQRQRLALARAIAHRPAILVLDEATSALDPATEARVHQNLTKLGCTRIVIAHRLVTVEDADRVLVFSEGRIVQQGSYEALSATAGPFRDLATGLS